MFWNATMPIWIGVLFVLAVALLALAGWLKAWETSWNASRIEARLITQRDEARTQRDKLNTENANIHAQLADRNEALQEAMAEIKALQMNTIEVPEVAPVKRTRKKAGAQ